MTKISCQSVLLGYDIARLYTNQPTPITRLRSIIPYKGVEAIRRILSRSPMIRWQTEECRIGQHSLKLIDALEQRGVFKPPKVTLTVRKSFDENRLRVLSVYSTGDIETVKGHNDRSRITLSLLDAAALRNPYEELLCKAYALVTGATIVNQSLSTLQQPLYEKGNLIGSEVTYATKNITVKIRSFSPSDSSRQPVLASSVAFGVTLVQETEHSPLRRIRMVKAQYYFGHHDTAWLLQRRGISSHWESN